MSETRVYVVEDEPIQREILTELLSDSFNLQAFDHGDKFLEAFEEQYPSVVILDIGLPGKSGYEICEILRQSYSQALIKIIFLSGHSSLDERLKGYELGADDYITKPFDIQELNNKIQNATDIISAKSALKQQADYASTTAFQAMTAQSEMGIILQGVRTMNEVKDFQSLINATFECLTNLDLTSTLYYEIADVKAFVAPPGRQTTPIEEQIIGMVRPMERIWTKGSRSMYNFEHCSLLILNMPDDQEKLGRYRDILCFLMEAFDARLEAIYNLGALMDAKQWRESIGEITRLLAKSSEKLEDSVTQSSSVVTSMIGDLEYLLPGMGLEEDQEKCILDIVDNASQKFRDSLETSEQTRDVFHKVVEKLKAMIN